MTTLKEAQKDPKKLKQFIKEHEGEIADADEFVKLMESATQTSTTTRPASSQDDSES